MAIERRGDSGCTVTGNEFWPGSPRPADFNLFDLAHSLSQQCRFGGHSRVFYSVAQHSVLVSKLCHPDMALWGLLHDASEAFLGDMVRPLKQDPRMAGYLEIEAEFMRCIRERFGLKGGIPFGVKVADEIALWHEAHNFMPAESVKTWAYMVQMDPAMSPLVLNAQSPLEARDAFLYRYHEIEGLWDTKSE